MPRIRESELVIPTLQVLAQSSDGFVTTSQLIETLDQRFLPNGLDATILSGRTDTRFSQKVRNLVSHRTRPKGLQTRGWANYYPDLEGWEITEAGRKILNG